MPFDDHHHCTVRPHRHLCFCSDIWPILLEPLRTTVTHPVGFNDTCCTCRYLLLGTRLPRVSDGPLHCAQCYLDRHGHGGSLPSMDQYSTGMLYFDSHCCCNLPLELCQQRHHLYHRSFWMVHFSLRNDGHPHL